MAVDQGIMTFNHEGWYIFDIETGGYHFWIAGKSMLDALTLYLSESDDSNEDELSIRALNNEEADTALQVEIGEPDQPWKHSTMRAETVEWIAKLVELKSEDKAFHLGDTVG